MNLTRLSAQLDASLTRFKALDLGYTYDDEGPSPCLGVSTDKKVHYPSLYVNRVKDDTGEVPESGTAQVTYKLTGRSMSQRGGKKRYGMDVEILSFDPVAAQKKDEKKQKDGEAVKVALAKLEILTELSDRTRNGDGQFVGNETAGVDPVTMKQAYGGKLKPGGAVAALLGGGALLGTKSGRVAAAGVARGASRVVRSSVAGLDRKARGAAVPGR